MSTPVRHVLGISGGKDSAALAIYLKNKYPDLEIDFYTCDTKCELTETEELVDKCRYLGAKSVVITSAKVEEKDCVIVYDHIKNELSMINFDMIDIRFPGTGDIFSAVLISDVLNNMSLHEATEHAMKTVRALILENKDIEEKLFGVNIEKFIEAGKL